MHLVVNDRYGYEIILFDLFGHLFAVFLNIYENEIAMHHLLDQGFRFGNDEILQRDETLQMLLIIHHIHIINGFL